MAGRTPSLRHLGSLLPVLLQSTVRYTGLLRRSSLRLAYLPRLHRYTSAADLVTRRANILQGGQVPWGERDSPDTERFRDVEILDAICPPG